MPIDDSGTPVGIDEPEPGAAQRRIVLSFCGTVLLGVLLVAGVIISVRSNLPDPDTWYHAVAGEEVLATHAWPTVDRYSFTAYGRDSMTLEWLGDVLIAEAARQPFNPYAGDRRARQRPADLLRIQLRRLSVWRCRRPPSVGM